MTLAACSTPKGPLGAPSLPYPPSGDPQVGEILHMPTGVLVSEQDMLNIATEARVIFVGETHDNPASHRLQLDLLRTLRKRYPGRVVLAMEMFTPSQQSVLDKWVAGEMTEKEFLRDAKWYSGWRMNYALYRPLLEYARQEKIPVLGINAEKSLVKMVGRTPLEDLSEEDRAKLPEMDFSDPYQQALVRSIFKGHGHGNSQIDGFLRVQTLWDETMAENIANFLRNPKHEGTHLLVMAGGNHIRYGFGIPRRVFRRVPVSYVLVGSREIVIPEERKDQFMDVEHPEFPMVPYEFVLFTEYELDPDEPVMLGVFLEEEDNRVTIGRIVPDSAAATAGLREGDVILNLDGEPVAEIFDVIYAVRQKRPGDSVRLEIERDGQREAVEASFQEKDIPHGQ